MESIPGGRIERFITNVWKFWFVAMFMIAQTYITGVLSSTKNIDLKSKRTNQVCVLTGGARGIGFEMVKRLLQLDYTIILGVRDISVMEKKVKNLREEGISTGLVKLFHLDLKSLCSVQNFANEVLANTNRIDLLINNAGIAQRDYEVTVDNLEVHFQVNYLSHFLLTKLLLPRIKETARLKTDGPCHIFNTSSNFHMAGNLQFDNLANKKIYIPITCYYDTKLCQVMHSKSIQNQLENEGVGNVFMYSAHPGVIATDILGDSGDSIYSAFFVVIRPLLMALFRTADTAADVILYPALNPSISKSCGGKYYEHGTETSPNRQAEDAQIRNKLWDMSSKLVEPFS